MRKYHIYIQYIKIISFNLWNEMTTYKWLPWEYLGYVSGTKDLYTYFRNYVKLYKIFFIRSVKFHNSFEYDNRCFNKKYIDCRRRFLIVDDSGNIRSFDDLTKAYRKHKMRHYGHYAYQIRRHVSNVQERRRSIVPDEIKEAANEYGIYLNEPKRIIAPWAFDNYRKKSKCWKDQSKRRRQWKNDNA
jgi:hypothetical protein